MFVEFLEVEQGVADLADVDGAAETGFLRVVAFELHAFLVVPDGVCSYGRVVGDLLADQVRGSLLILPLSQVQLAQEGIEGLFLGSAKAAISVGV